MADDDEVISGDEAIVPLLQESDTERANKPMASAEEKNSSGDIQVSESDGEYRHLTEKDDEDTAASHSTTFVSTILFQFLDVVGPLYFIGFPFML